MAECKAEMHCRLHHGSRVCRRLREAVWLRNYLLDLGIISNLPRSITVYCDNTGAVANLKEPRSHKVTKHIERKYHIIREIVRRGDVQVEKIATLENLADPFTKSLPQKVFDRHVRRTWTEADAPHLGIKL